jgi:transposase InsO family protein
MTAWRALEPAIRPRGRGRRRWQIRIEPDAAEYAAQWPAWGYRKIAAIAAADGCDVGSAASVKRAMARRDLLQPVRYQAVRRQLARARRKAFVEAPVRRNRVQQADFTWFETGAEGTWRLCPVVDYATKLALACPITPTQSATDLISALQAAVDAAETLLGCRLIEDCADSATGEIVPLVVVTDNGPAMKSVATARWFAARSHLTHVRTRHRAPHTNGVVERWINTLKYEHLYRHDIASGPDLADQTIGFVDEYNTIRPHQALGQTPPLAAYLNDRTLKPNPPKNEQKT